MLWLQLASKEKGPKTSNFPVRVFIIPLGFVSFSSPYHMQLSFLDFKLLQLAKAIKFDLTRKHQVHARKVFDKTRKIFFCKQLVSSQSSVLEKTKRIHTVLNELLEDLGLVLIVCNSLSV